MSQPNPPVPPGTDSTGRIVFWAEPNTILTDEAFITIGAGDIIGGARDGDAVAVIVIHTRDDKGEISCGWAHLSATQAAELIAQLSGARAALVQEPPTIGGVE